MIVCFIYKVIIISYIKDDEGEFECQVGPQANKQPIRSSAHLTLIGMQIDFYFSFYTILNKIDRNNTVNNNWACIVHFQYIYFAIPFILMVHFNYR